MNQKNQKNQDLEGIPITTPNDKLADYTEKVKKDEEEKARKAEEERQKSLYFLGNRIASKKPKAPDQIKYDFVRNLFWEFYITIIHNETKIPFEKIKLDGNMKEVIRNFVHWMIGSEKGYDPRKSLYFWSKLGVGKSTIAATGSHVLAYLEKEYKWSARNYRFASMDALFLKTYTSQSLKAIGELATGNWCLDEMKEEHLKYKHYGNDILMLSDILSARHHVWKTFGTTTIITSNVPFKYLEDSKVFDERVIDRIKQEYIEIELIGKNKRSPSLRL